MANLTDQVRNPGIAGLAPNYVAVSASDTFQAVPNARYVLHYKCGGTPTGVGDFKVVDTTTPTPAGAELAAGFADAVVQDGGMLASTERVAVIPNSNRFRNSSGVITLTHGGTLTTVTLAIMGPFPA